MGMFGNLFKNKNERDLSQFNPLIEKINLLEEDIQNLSDDELKAKTGEFKERLGKGETLEDLLPEAFAVVRETAMRTLGQRHYDVQLVGGIILHQGSTAEMKTGEGKTLVATLPAYLNALTEKGVHIVTVNDYLSRRDAVWMGQIFVFHGLSVGVVGSQRESFIRPRTQARKRRRRRARREWIVQGYPRISETCFKARCLWSRHYLRS